MHLAILTYGPGMTSSPDVMLGLLQAVLPPLSWATLLYVAYATTLLFAGLLRRYACPDERPAQTRFAIVIPAHNEAHVLGPLLQECASLLYPKALYDTYVVADNCTDETAQIAVSHGAIAFERRNRKQVGKGYALDYAFERILAKNRHDALLVIDADNLPDPNLLRHMNNHILAGHRIIQSRKDVKNPNDGIIAALKTMLVWTSNRFWFLAKHNIGCSAVLLGSGMCIATDVIREYGWGAYCLTEDFEFTAKTLSQGVRAHWADEALIYEEEPTDLKQVWKQHVRWSRGQNWVLAHYGPRLLIQGIFNGDFIKIEGALQLFQSVFPVVTLVVGVLSYLGGAFMYLPILGLIPSWAWLLASGLQYCAPLVAYRLDGLRNPLPLRYIWLYPLLTSSWVVVNLYALLTCRASGWHVTQHTRPLSLAEVARSGPRN